MTWQELVFAFPTDTQGALQALLVENTGGHFLDSGGAYGRNHEKNRRQPPWDRPRLIYWDHDALPSLNVWHYLNELALARTARSIDMEADFRAWVDLTPRGAGYYNSSTSLQEWIKERGLTFVALCNNANNGDDMLTQNLLWGAFEDPDGQLFLALSIHQGCDLRGGYTDFRFFESDEGGLPFGGSLHWSCPRCRYDGGLHEAVRHDPRRRPSTEFHLKDTGRRPWKPPILRPELACMECPCCHATLDAWI